MERCHPITGAANPTHTPLPGYSELSQRQQEIVQNLIRMFGSSEIDEELVAGRIEHVIWHYANLMLTGRHHDGSTSDGARLFTLSLLARLFRNNLDNQYI